MSKRRKVHSGAPWESLVGYCRAVRCGSHVYVSGTAPVDDEGEVFAAGDPYAQTKRCIEIIEEALREAGASLDDVVRTRMFVTDIEHWQDFAKAHREAFEDIEPATSMLQVGRLIDPRMLIEIEADAIVGSD